LLCVCICASVVAQDPAENSANSALELPQAPSAYRPVTGEQRLSWFVRSTVGYPSLTGGLFSAGFGTAINNPHEYGPHWNGFAQRYGMRLTGISTGNAMEASLGTLWGEDPRYFRAAGQPFKQRVKNIVDLTFRSCRKDGKHYPAYARYAGDFGNNFLSNTWRVPSEADWQHAEGMGNRALSNTYDEFSPDLWGLLHRKKGHH